MLNIGRRFSTISINVNLEEIKMVPNYLYHYTSINTLALILKNKTFRFNSLNNMDDYDEVNILDKKLGKYSFISCWTDLADESIPMWKMYSNNLAGVRIRMPIFPFEVYKVGGIEYIIHPEEIINNNYYYNDPTVGKLLKQVTYNSIERVENIKNGDIAKKSYEMLGFDSCLAGSYKNDYWKFQSEWRYILRIIPSREKVNHIDTKIDNEYLSTLPDLPIHYKDLKIDIEKFQKMEITLGPKVDAGEEIIVNSLVEKYNPKAKILYSQLRNRM